MNNNFILRPEFFGGLLIDRDNLEQWELDNENMIYLWAYYHTKNSEESNRIAELIFEKEIDIHIDTIEFCNNHVFEIPTKWRCLNNLVDFGKDMLKKIENKNYLSCPLEVSLYLTNNCQLNCQFCFMNKHLNKGNFLSLNQIKKIINMFVDNGVQSFSLLGGEPLLHPNIIEICEYIEENKIHFVITTNGINLSEEMMLIFKEMKYLKIVFSLQSLDELNEQLMGIHSQYIIDKIDQAIDFNITININTVFSIQNEVQIIELLEFALKKRANRYSIAIYSDNGNENIKKPSILKIKSLKKTIENYLISNEIVDKISFALEGCMLYSAYYNNENVSLSSYEKILYGCEAAQTKLDITPYNSAVACMVIFDKNVHVENIKDKSFEEIWDNPIFDLLRKYVVQDSFCLNCNYVSFCNGGCFRNKKIKNNIFSSNIDENCFRLVGAL